MRPFFLLLLVFSTTLSFAQPTSTEVKKHRIKKVTETTNVDGEVSERVWVYTINGYDSMHGVYGEFVNIRNELSGNRLSKKIFLKADGSNGDVYTYEYDSKGNYKETYTDGSFQMVSYAWFDNKGKQLKAQSPDGNITDFKYDSKGKLLSVISRGNNNGVKIKKIYTYNPKGQLVKLDYTDFNGTSSVTTYKYDAKGRLLQKIEKGGWEGEDAVTTSTYEYNEKGLVSKVSSKIKNGSSESMISELDYEYYKP